MGHLTNDEFFAKLAELFAARKSSDHGAIYLVQKRFSFTEQPTSSAEPTSFPEPVQPSAPLPILIRATNGKCDKSKKIKLSTLVEPSDLDLFYGRYAEVCKTGMGALKPRDRTKRKAKAKKKKAV